MPLFDLHPDHAGWTDAVCPARQLFKKGHSCARPCGCGAEQGNEFAPFSNGYRSDPDALLIDLRLDEPCQVSQRILPTEITSLRWNDVRHACLRNIQLGADRYVTVTCISPGRLGSSGGDLFVMHAHREGTTIESDCGIAETHAEC